MECSGKLYVEKVTWCLMVFAFWAFEGKYTGGINPRANSALS